MCGSPLKKHLAQKLVGNCKSPEVSRKRLESAYAAILCLSHWFWFVLLLSATSVETSNKIRDTVTAVMSCTSQSVGRLIFPGLVLVPDKSDSRFLTKTGQFYAVLTMT